MCDLHPNCATVSALERANLSQPSSPGGEGGVDDAQTLPPGFLTLTEEEYASTIRQHGIERYYDVSRTPISMGQWASVFKCRLRSTGAEFAAKFCDKLRLGLYAHQEIIHEVAALRQCRRCPRFVQLYEVFETDDQYVLVMELGSGGDLQAILDDNQVPYESDVIRFMRNMLEGLVFIHERNIAHLDIKPQNVVLTGEFPDCDVKLCDLEISRVTSPGQEIREMLGTPDYVAPEILRFDPVTLTADIWSVGVLAYVLLTGFTPFGGDTDTETFRNISKAELDFPEELFEDVSELARDFIRRCLVKDPKGRLSARQSLMHPWLQQTESPARAPSIHGSNQSIRSGGDTFGSTDSVRTLRRSVSKSREVLCEKVSHSNLKKNISKSRERLCDLKFGLSKSRERIPPGFRVTSRSSEVLSNKPPWRAAGVNCPLGKPLPPPMERMGSFKVRDQYQSQVVASLGSNQSINSVGCTPFVRHCSLRGRRKPPPTVNEQPADFRASLRRNKQNRRNSLQMEQRPEEEPRPKDTRRRSTSSREEAEVCPRLEKRRDSRKELSLPPDEGKNMIIVEIISDGEEEDVFTRLYKDRLKDSELKWRKLKDSDFDDDEKENKSWNKSEQLSVRRRRSDQSRSRESVNGSNGSKSGSDETLVDRLNTLQGSGSSPPSTPGESVGSRRRSSAGSTSSPVTENGKEIVPSWPAEITQPMETSPPPDEQQQDQQADAQPQTRETEPQSEQPSAPETETYPSQRPERERMSSYIHRGRASGDGGSTLERRRRVGSSGSETASTKSLRPRTSSKDSEGAPRRRSRAGSDETSPPALIRRALGSRTDDDASPSPASTRSSISPESTPSPRASMVEQSEPARDSQTPVRESEAPASGSEGAQRWLARGSGATAEISIPPRWRRTASSSPEPGAPTRRRRPGLSAADPAATATPWTSTTTERSVNTDTVATRDRGINTVLTAAVVDDSAVWERTQVLSSERRRSSAALEHHAMPVVAALRDTFERHLDSDVSRNAPRDAPRQTSVPPVEAAAAVTSPSPLTKSSTDEDVRRRMRSSEASSVDDKPRSVAFVESCSERKRGPNSNYRRCSSLSSDLGSSELSSDTGSESYCIVSWEAAPTPTAEESAAVSDADRATELKPIVTTRVVGRPRSVSTQMDPRLVMRQRGRSHSVAAEPFGAAQPWGSLCSGSVARAFQKFHSMEGSTRSKRRQSSPNIAAFGGKVSDMGQV